MKKLLAKIPKGVYFTHPDQRIADINKTARKWFKNRKFRKKNVSPNIRKRVYT